MVDRSRKRLTKLQKLQLPLVVLLLMLPLVCLKLMMVNSWNLNEEPEQEEGTTTATISGVAGSKKLQANKAASSAMNKRDSNNSNKISAEKIKRLQEIYPKILKLFDVLKVCDDDEFDINTIELPQKWSDQGKALMVLHKIGKQKLIKKNDMARYQRIMKNCNLMDRTIRAREAASLSLESQISGMNQDELELYRKYINENPLEEVRERLLSAREIAQPSIVKQAARPSEAFKSQLKPTKEPEFVITNMQPLHPSDGDGHQQSPQPQLIRFL